MRELLTATWNSFRLVVVPGLRMRLADEVTYWAERHFTGTTFVRPVDVTGVVV